MTDQIERLEAKEHDFVTQLQLKVTKSKPQSFVFKLLSLSLHLELEQSFFKKSLKTKTIFHILSGFLKISTAVCIFHLICLKRFFSLYVLIGALQHLNKLSLPFQKDSCKFSLKMLYAKKISNILPI